MPYQIDWKEKYCVIHYSGAVVASDLLGVIDDLTGHKGLTSYYNTLNNFTDAETFELSDKELDKVHAFNKALSLTNPISRIALVSQNGAIHQWCVLFQQENPIKDWTLELFEDLSEAEQWLSQ